MMFINMVGEVFIMVEKQGHETKTAPPPPQEMEVIIHHRDGGPSLESCMVSILSGRMSESTGT